MNVRLENSGYEISLDRPIGSGGMGTTYLHQTNDGMVAKEMYDDFPEEKVRYLIARPPVPSRGGYAFAWPTDIGIEVATGKAKMYFMPKAEDAVDLPAVMAAADWLPEKFKYRVMLNKVRALLDLQQADYFRGDMPNAMVDPEGFITEIDLDSLQVSHRDVQYLCGVGKPDWLAPQLIGPLMAGELGDIPTTSEHDAWSIAVSLWMLLRADHPFDCRYVGPGKRPPRLERIKDGCWAYSTRHPDFQPRRGTPPLTQLDPELAFLFRQSFEAGHATPTDRPKLAVWEAVLSRLDTADEVTLCDSDWQCVKVGARPRNFARGKFGKAAIAFPVTAAASLAIFGGVDLLRNSVEPTSVFHQAHETESISNFLQPQPKEPGITEITSAAPPEITNLQQVHEPKTVVPPIDFHSVAPAHQSELPALWKHIKEHLQ